MLGRLELESCTLLRKLSDKLLTTMSAMLLLEASRSVNASKSVMKLA
jgi:hypothetical protein